MNYRIKCETGIIVITPYILAKIADDFHNSATLYNNIKNFSLATYSMYLSSIERGLKAAILSRGCTQARKCFLAKCIGHDLEKVIEEFEIHFTNILSSEDKINIKKVNKLYFKKGFDYFSDEMLGEMFNGYKNLPELKVIMNISKKVNKFIIDKQYFLNI